MCMWLGEEGIALAHRMPGRGRGAQRHLAGAILQHSAQHAAYASGRTTSKVSVEEGPKRAKPGVSGTSVSSIRPQPCVVCGRARTEAHHIRFAQPRAFSRKAAAADTPGPFP